MLPPISLGLWHNFGKNADDDTARRMIYESFDLGITHFDLANNYGPPPGSAEKRFGKIISDMPSHLRDEMIISTKAGFRMWDGPYGEWGSRKNLLASLDQSLQRMKLDYVDIFYHHRPDPDTPLDETMGALDQAVRSGKALYAGISNYNGLRTSEAVETCIRQRYPRLLIHQVAYNMFQRGPETDLFGHTSRFGMGAICFCPLAQGMLTDKYLGGIPRTSRAADKDGFLQESAITPDVLQKITALNELAKRRGQSLAQMAIAWVLRADSVCSALIGASRPEQIHENVAALENLTFTAEEYSAIDRILASPAN